MGDISLDIKNVLEAALRAGGAVIESSNDTIKKIILGLKEMDSMDISSIESNPKIVESDIIPKIQKLHSAESALLKAIQEFNKTMTELNIPPIDKYADLNRIEEKSESKKKLKDNVVDIFRILGYENSDKLAKIAAELDIPDVESQEGGKDETKEDDNLAENTTEKEEPKEDNSKNIDELQKSIDNINDSIKDLESEKKFKDLSEDISILSNSVKTLQNQLNEFKEKNVPKRRQFETEGAYRENLFTIASYVLDDILTPLFSAPPDYNLIATQISRSFDDGTVCDAIVSITVTVPNEGYRYDFKVDVPILNGVAQAPLYIQRGLKTIPLTQSRIQEELSSISFRKIEVEDMASKDNMFNSIGENRYKRPDKQKMYPVNENRMPPVGLPPSPRWNNKTERGV